MAKRLKRAFTIVELVIVIAVIAILAAVLIPTFTTLIDKANQSNDTVTVKNLNTAITATEATEEINTMQDALDAAQEYGYTVDKLTPTSSGDIVWDEVSKRFALLDSDGKVVYEDSASKLTTDHTKIWKIVDKLEGTQDYSWYVGKLDEASIEAFTFTMGVDTGSVAADVKYERNGTAQNVTIRTAGGALTVNAASDTVNHYGAAQSADIQAVDTNSYHEFGEVLGSLTITTGHVVFENTAVVNTFVVAEGATAVTASFADSAQVLTAVAADNGTLDGLSLPATVEQVVVENYEVLKGFAGGAGTEKSPYLIADKASLKVIQDNFSSQMAAGTPYYFKLIADITIEENDSTVAQLSNGDYAIISDFNGVFDGNGYSLTWGYYTPSSDTTWFTFIYNIKPAEAQQTVTIKNLNVYLKSFSAPMYFTLIGNIGSGYSYGVLPGQIVLENIDFFNADQGSASFPSNNHGILGGYVAANVTVRDCNNYLNASSTGTNGIWFGAMQFDGYKVKFERVNNYGVYSGTSLGYFFGNDSYIQFGNTADRSINFTLDQIKACVEVVDCYNEGVIYKTAGQNKFFMFGSSGAISGTAWEEFSDEILKDFNKNGGVATYLQSSGKISYEVVDGKISVSNASSEVSKLTLSYTTMYMDSEGNHGGFSLTIDITNALGSQYKAKFATTIDGALDGYTLIDTVSEEESANGVEYFICKKGDDYYYVFNNLADHLPAIVKDDVALQGVTITINGYNSSNTLVDYTKVA